MARFYAPDYSTTLDSPFARDADNKLVRRSYWMDMSDKTLVMVMVNGIGANLTNEESFLSPDIAEYLTKIILKMLDPLIANLTTYLKINAQLNYKQLQGISQD